MNITEPFVLKQSVQLIPCAELSDDLRAKITFEEGDFTLSHRYGRALAQVIDGETAALLALFREPRTIVDAVIENSRLLGRDPEARLDELLPHIGAFVTSRVLVPAGSDEEQEIRPQYESGDAFAGWKIVRCASLVEDSEVYQLRRGDDVAALKIARLANESLRATFDNESEVLRHLEGSGIAPRLLEDGLDAERPYLIAEWVAGVDAAVAASQRRHDRAALIDLCASIATAYETLHARGVLHGDVHPRNVLAGDAVTLVDFGYARFTDRPPRRGRAGLMYFFEPESFAAPSVPASAAGEQYAVAALLYFLIAGDHYLDFRYDRDEMVRQVTSDPPLPFARRNVPPWPEVEAILLRALEKDPSRRFASMGEMAALLREARDRTLRESLEAPLAAEATAFLEETLRSMARGGETFTEAYAEAPTASINYGCAGAAVGLLRIAETRGDPALLALADVWRSRAASRIGTAEAYYDPERELTHEALGDVTPYHTESGIHAAAAMIAAAMGDTLTQARALRAFLRASRHPCAELDLTLGRSGSLLAASMLLDLDDVPELRAFGAETMRAIGEELDARPPIADSPSGTYLGMAHGWCGYLYAALRWCASSGDALPPRLVERLHELAELKLLKDRGAYWPATIGRAMNMPGWCNGSAGPLFLFTLAHRLLGDPEWLRLAELAAWNNWDEPRNSTTLCCGTAGRAYALLSLYKHTGAPEWLSRARHLANHAATNAAATSQRRNSLWKGELGVAVLVADLASPENARMPFFE
ncbi:MAG TPA: lanthionine synthetase LanC family protein [Thermoanaerobaculia bacterium]